MDRLGDEIRRQLLAGRNSPRRRGELLSLGLADHDIRRLVRNEQLQLHRRHYLEAGIDEAVAKMICAQAAYPRSVISHFSAARLAGLHLWTDSRRPDRPPLDAVWLTRLPTEKRNHRREDIVVRRAGLTNTDLTRHSGLLVTSATRTVVDLARELTFREAIVTVDQALRSGVPMARLQAVLARQQGWPGSRRAREVIEFGDSRSESALESIARAAFAAAGLPPPILQARFWDGSRWMAERVDFWWPQFRTVGEADGLAKYDAATPEERRRLMRLSHVRDHRLADRAVELVHFGWEDALDDPRELAARFRAAFRRGLARSGDAPTWRAPDRHDPTRWQSPDVA